MICGFFPALDKAGWREAPGWFEAVIPLVVTENDQPVGVISMTDVVRKIIGE